MLFQFFHSFQLFSSQTQDAGVKVPWQVAKGIKKVLKIASIFFKNETILALQEMELATLQVNVPTKEAHPVEIVQQGYN